jgi:sulfoxide reductase heme-binding subunit YedZ
LVLLNFFDVNEMMKDVFERPFITIGMATFLILLALAVTSNQFSIRRLGRRWQRLHRLAYAAAIGAVIHFWWLVKEDVTEPRRWLVIVTLLLGLRAWWAWKRRVSRPATAS